MKAIDTNILVYAYDRDSPFFLPASTVLRELSEGLQSWAIPWPCIYEFLRVMTHPKAIRSPVPIQEAWSDILLLFQTPSLMLLSETARHPQIMSSLLKDSPVTGNLVHDAHIAALLMEHGVGEIITADHDFRRFPQLTVTNPFQVETYPDR